ncbi:MAG: hypothetical protein J2P49_02125 [Methylocapsa sp.]|nr:hypothetical protein [Methylocapsa sp.]
MAGAPKALAAISQTIYWMVSAEESKLLHKKKKIQNFLSNGYIWRDPKDGANNAWPAAERHESSWNFRD